MVGGWFWFFLPASPCGQAANHPPSFNAQKFAASACTAWGKAKHKKQDVMTVNK